MSNLSEMSWFRGNEIKHSLEQIKKIVNTGIFESNSPLVTAAFTQVIILLSDLLIKANIDGKRIDFAEDVKITSHPNGDITDLIREMRNSVCHITSNNRRFEGANLICNVFSGYVPNAISINGATIGCNYSDDIAINYGGMVVYLKRHIIRCWDLLLTIYPETAL